jgi:nicotinate-nucleotide pyrophosphorylase (carboxylating)
MDFYNQQLEILIKNALAEDIGDGDHSTLSCIPSGAKGSAVLKVKEQGLIAGVSVAEKIFRTMQPDCFFTFFKKDGEKMEYGEIAFEVEADVQTILQCERLVLNCMQRMSGIATLTRKYVDRLKDSRSKLLDTRKTTPNFRLLEKEAVRIGGGVNHRFGLFDMIMLKDNHIDYCGGIEKAIEKAYTYRNLINPLLRSSCMFNKPFTVSILSMCVLLTGCGGEPSASDISKAVGESFKTMPIAVSSWRIRSASAKFLAALAAARDVICA